MVVKNQFIHILCLLPTPILTTVLTPCHLTRSRCVQKRLTKEEKDKIREEEKSKHVLSMEMREKKRMKINEDRKLRAQLVVTGLKSILQQFNYVSIVESMLREDAILRSLAISKLKTENGDLTDVTLQDINRKAHQIGRKLFQNISSKVRHVTMETFYFFEI